MPKKHGVLDFFDKVLDKNHKIFTAQIKHLASAYIADKSQLQKTLEAKVKTRCFDEGKKALAAYRQFELTQMNQKINGDEWEKTEVQDFIDKWGKHIIHSDMTFHQYIKLQTS